MYRTALALVVLATVSGCAYEERHVYRDQPRYGVWGDNDDRFRPRRGVVCDEGDRVCYRNGWPNRKATRNVFGKRAVRQRDWD